MQLTGSQLEHLVDMLATDSKLLTVVICIIMARITQNKFKPMFSPLLPPNPHVLPMAADQCHEKMSGKSDFLKNQHTLANNENSVGTVQ